MNRFILILSVMADNEEEAIKEFQQKLWDMSADPEDIRISMDEENE